MVSFNIELFCINLICLLKPILFCKGSTDQSSGTVTSLSYYGYHREPTQSVCVIICNFLNKCIGFTICFFCSDIDKYVHGPMLNKRCITLPAVYCGILSDFEDLEFAVYCAS